MNAAEATQQEARVKKFRELDAQRTEAWSALSAIRAEEAFTGNWRESRLIEGAQFFFSHTRGGEAPLNASFKGLNISAYAVGQALVKLLEERLEAINKALAEV